MFHRNQSNAVLALSVLIAFVGYWPAKSNFDLFKHVFKLIYFNSKNIIILNFQGNVNAISSDAKSRAIYYHDLYRSRVARGLQKNKNGTYLPKGKNIYAMVKLMKIIVKL